MQQKAKNHKNLKRIVNQIPLPGGKLSFPCMICQSQDDELQKRKGTKHAGQTGTS